MSNWSSATEVLVREGRFQDALDQLERLHRDHPTAPTVGFRLDLAELYERTGRLPESRILLDAVKGSTHLSDTERARCSLLDGLLLKHRGHLPAAVAAFRQASRIAERAGALDLLCWSQLRLMGVAGDVDGDPSPGPAPMGLRRNVERAAVPSISIAYHVFSAEQEAKSGRLIASRRHGQLAESLLSSHPNYWLRGILEVQTSCLHYLEGDFLAALEAAQRALDASRLSGNRQTRLIALADMAAAYLAIGQPARAQICLAPALAEARPEEQVFGLLLETLAEAQLENRDVVGCGASLEQAREIAAEMAQSRSSWHRAWNLRTEVRLLQRLGRWRESLQLIRKVARVHRSETGGFTTSQVRVLETLALMRSGQTEEAVVAVLGLLTQPPEVTRSYHGLAVAAAARLLDSFGTPTEGVNHVAHALRILGGTGEASSLVEFVDQYVDESRVPDSSATVGSTPSTWGRLWRPTRIVCHLEATTSTLGSALSRESNLVALLGALPDLRSEPRTLGEEVLRLLSERGWIRSGAVRASEETGSEDLVTSGERLANEPRGENDSDTDYLLRVDLGRRHGTDYVLLLKPRASGASSVYCAQVGRFVTSLVERRSHGAQEAEEVTSGADTHPCEDEIGLFRSLEMLALVASAKRVAPLRITTLLSGESGTGKEVIAGIMHRASGVPAAPFVAFNCATIPHDMVESQLFGYKRGAFTGAVQSFKGVIRAAAGGTLFLDEVGELPLDVQPKLLRFLDSGEIQPLGEAVPQVIGVRVIAATNADLEAMIKQGRFREDLYYRLNVVHLHVPPLRERRDEIAPLASWFLARYTEEFGKSEMRLSDEALEHLLLYSWPGNVRQLSSEMRRLAALNDSGAIIGVRELRPEFVNVATQPPVSAVTDGSTLTVRIDRPLPSVVHDVERAALLYAMRMSQGRMDLAAKRLGISRKGLYLKRQRLGLRG